MSKKYSIYDFPELLYNAKLLTNRQRCIILCLFSFLNLKGGGAFTIDILSEKTGIRKEHLYRELKSLTYTKEVDGVKKEFSIIKREGKKISLDIERLREFISAKLASSNSAKTASVNCQNGTKKLPKQHLDSAKLAVSKCQNGTKKSPESQEPQSPESGVNNIFRKDFLDKNSQNRVLDNTHNNSAREEGRENFDKRKLEISKQEIKREIEAESKGLDYTQVRETVEKIKLSFKKSYKERYKVPPAFSQKALSVLIDYCLNHDSVEELKEFEEKLLSKIPAFFRNFKNDKFVQDRRYDFVAFVHRIPQLLNLYERDGSIQHQEHYEFEEVSL